MSEFTRFLHVFLVMSDCFACYSGFFSLFGSPLSSHTLPCDVTFSVLLKNEHNCQVFMCACLTSLLYMCITKEKIKWISPKCVLFHILFGKFVKLNAFICDYVMREVSWYRYISHFLADFVWCTVTHTFGWQGRMKEKWWGCNSHKIMCTSTLRFNRMRNDNDNVKREWFSKKRGENIIHFFSWCWNCFPINWK